MKGAFIREGPLGVLLGFNSLFSLILINLDRVLGQDKKGKKFWIDRLIINIAEGAWFQPNSQDQNPSDSQGETSSVSVCDQLAWTHPSKNSGNFPGSRNFSSMPSLPLDKLACLDRAAESGMQGSALDSRSELNTRYMLSPGVCCVRSL